MRDWLHKTNILVAVFTFSTGVFFATGLLPTMLAPESGLVATPRSLKPATQKCRPGDVLDFIEKQISDTRLELLEVGIELKRAKTDHQISILTRKEKHLKAMLDDLERERDLQLSRYSNDGTTKLIYRELCFEP